MLTLTLAGVPTQVLGDPSRMFAEAREIVSDHGAGLSRHALLPMPVDAMRRLLVDPPQPPDRPLIPAPGI